MVLGDNHIPPSSPLPSPSLPSCLLPSHPLLSPPVLWNPGFQQVAITWEILPEKFLQNYKVEAWSWAFLSQKRKCMQKIISDGLPESSVLEERSWFSVHRGKRSWVPPHKGTWRNLAVKKPQSLWACKEPVGRVSAGPGDMRWHSSRWGCIFHNLGTRG